MTCDSRGRGLPGVPDVHGDEGPPLRGSQGARHLFVQKVDFDDDLNNWDTAGVTDFFEMFSYGAEVLDGELNAWDTSRLTNMKLRNFETVLAAERASGLARS